MSIYKRGSTWWINLSHKGERIRQSANTEIREEAQRQHDQIKAELWNRKNGKHYLSDALTLWIKAADRNDREKSALRIFRTLYKDRLLSEITGQCILDAFEGRSSATANRTISIIRAAINMAVAAGWCAPIRIPKRKEPVSRLRWLTRKEWNKLYASLPPHLKAPALFALSTGLRQANVLALQWHQVDMKRRVMWVQAEAMKAKKAIGLPLSEDALSALRMAQSAKGYVFTYKGEPMKQIKTAFTKAKARAKVDCTWHDLRHTFASWHVQSGTPLAVVKELGGWSTMDMVMRYAHLAPDHLAEWANNVTKMAQPKRKAASPR